MELISFEQMDAATDALLETGKKVGADSWQQRVKNQTPHCKFGESGACCKFCSMGPCRITPKAPKGICGCDVHGIVARNFLNFTAGGAATHSDHGRNICHTLYQTKKEGPYKVKDPEKLIRQEMRDGIPMAGNFLQQEMSSLQVRANSSPSACSAFFRHSDPYRNVSIQNLSPYPTSRT